MRLLLTVRRSFCLWSLIVLALVAGATSLGPPVIAAQQPARPAAPQPRPTTTPPAAAAPTGMTNADVVNMVTAGLSEAIVTSAIRDAKTRSFDVTANGLIALKRSGVSEGVIAVMMNPTAVASPTPPSVVPSAPASPALVKVPDGTEVRLTLIDRLTSATAKVNDRVRFEVVEDVKIDGAIVIARKAQAVGTVFEAASKKSFGRSGKLNFTIDAVKGADGDNIRLRSTKENKGNESYGKAGVVTILAGPFGALVRGKDVEIEPGTEYTIYIDGDRTIQLQPAS